MPTYNNFTSAFNDWISDLNQYYQHQGFFPFDMIDWNSATTIFQLKLYGGRMFASLFNLIQLHTGLLYENYTQSDHYMAVWYAGQGGAAVDMNAILNAMLLAKYDELQKFVGIEDAYRSAIWDQPFNAQFYAALANGFRP